MFYRYKLVTGWKQPKTCQHPKHSSQKRNTTVWTVPLNTSVFQWEKLCKLPIGTVFCFQHLKGETPPTQKKKVDNKESDSKKNEGDTLPEDQEVDIQIDPEYEPEELSETDDSILEKSNESSNLSTENWRQVLWCFKWNTSMWQNWVPRQKAVTKENLKEPNNN